MKRWILLIVALAIAAFGGWRFWVLGSIPRLPASFFTVKLDTPGAEHQIHGQGEWMPLANGDSFAPGDTFRTNTSSLTLAFANHAEVRLDQHTSLTVEQSSQEKDGSMQVSLALLSGQAWSAVEPLFHAEDVFQIHAGNTVTIARGTSFNINATNDAIDISVTHDAVSVQSGTSSSSEFALVNEGYHLISGRDGVLGKPELLGLDQPNEWTAKNQTRDTQFSQAVRARNHAMIALLAPAHPESLLDGLTKLSEDFHLALYRTQVPLRYAAYASRRMIGLAAWCQAGNDGPAFQNQTALEEELKARLTGAQGADYTQAMRAWMPYIFVPFESIGPSSSCYRLKLHLEDLMQQLAGSDANSQTFAQQVVIGMQLDEASNLISTSSLDDAGTELEAARQGLGQTARNSSLSAALQARQSLLSNREASLQVHLATAISPPTNSFTVTTTTVAMLPADPVLATSTTATTSEELPSTSSTKITPKAPPVVVTIKSLSITPALSDVSANTQTSFHTIANYSDGTTKDVTAQTTFTSSNLLLGFTLKNIFTTNAAAQGQAIVSAEYAEGSKSLQASATVNIGLR